MCSNRWPGVIEDLSQRLGREALHRFRCQGLHSLRSKGSSFVVSDTHQRLWTPKSPELLGCGDGSCGKQSSESRATRPVTCKIRLERKWRVSGGGCQKKIGDSPSVRFNNSTTKVSVKRTVRNVGPAKSSYRLVIDPITGLDSTNVYPSALEFTEANQTASFRVDFTRNATATTPFSQGAVTWVSAGHSVRTPVAVLFE
ncbi:hypothetical protein NL676_009735 [Syzygium grande]|nr:hypothetical protein NL676_009735 [Syzygium grande]